jgi:hypothetical protein
MDDRAIECFDQTLIDAGITHEPVRTALHDYFVWATASLTRFPDSRDDVRDGLQVPLWSGCRALPRLVIRSLSCARLWGRRGAGCRGLRRVPRRG